MGILNRSSIRGAALRGAKCLAQRITSVLASSGWRSRGYLLFLDGASEEKRRDLRERAAFYLPNVKSLVEMERCKWGLWLSASPLLLGSAARRPPIARLRPGVFNVDFDLNPMDGWAWIAAANYVEDESTAPALEPQSIVQVIERLKAERRPRCYLFGTGPTLARALERDWHDGYRIVCNTIVRDPELYGHINPDIIVAGDAIYHFGHTAFARQFRADLQKRLENSRTIFVYPAHFDVIVRRELAHLEQQLCPVPVGSRSEVHTSFTDDPTLPNLGNVLNLLLLPICCNLSRSVHLWGFDGRAPSDVLFWSNSTKHSYAELLPVLEKAHPAFFSHFVPKDDPEQYVRAVHGDVLEYCLRRGEEAGWRFKMLHDTWTETLARRRAGD
ncbi:MAG: hypothetical protein Q8P50_02175 [Bacillota bacterium]|nr:hypothetical protein [Bacillota bacterium]